jgi:multidrug resistance efflux pump
VVKRGDVLAEIDAPEVHADAQKGRAPLHRARARWVRVESAVREAESSLVIERAKVEIRPGRSNEYRGRPAPSRESAQVDPRAGSDQRSRTETGRGASGAVPTMRQRRANPSRAAPKRQEPLAAAPGGRKGLGLPSRFRESRPIRRPAEGEITARHESIRSRQAGWRLRRTR